MADDNVTPPVATDGDSGTNWTLIGGLALLLVGGGVAAYFVFFNKPADKSKDKPDDKSDNKSDKKAAETTGKTDDKPVVETPATDTKTSPMRTDFDGAYNYQKRNGVWWTAKKSAPDTWVSLGDPKWKDAVDKLNARYPND